MSRYPIVLDPHIHSVASGHGTSDTVTDIAKMASKKDLQMIGITEHAPAMPGACKASYFRGLALAPRTRCGIRVCYGAEVNILDGQGTLDLPNDILAGLDYSMASMHTKCITPGDRDSNTTAYIEAMKNPHIHILGHPGDVAFPVNYETLVGAAAKYGVIPEINNASLAPDGYRGDVHDNIQELLYWCKTLAHPVVLSSDSHGKADVGSFSYAIAALIECDFPPELVLNGSVDGFLGCSYAVAPSAAMSSCKSVIGSPLDWK